MANIRLENISKIYGVAKKKGQLPEGKKAVNNINLNIPEGSFTILVGPSGCGKTTLLRMIAGLETITLGNIYINDIDVTNYEPGDRGLAMVFQNYALYPHMTIYENIEFGLKNARIPKHEIKSRIDYVLNLVNLSEYANRRPANLSGGQRQRVALARAIAKKPQVFLMDEPLSNLDAKLRSTMRSELIQIHRKLKSTFIYVTHDQIEAMTMGDYIVCMSEGIIKQTGTPTEIHDDPDNVFVAQFIGESNIIEGVFIKDYLVEFDGQQFECVDKGFDEGQEIDIVLRPEDLDIVEVDKGKIEGVVTSIVFKGVHYEIMVETKNRDYKVHTTDISEVGKKVNLDFWPEDIHVMDKMGSY